MNSSSHHKAMSLLGSFGHMIIHNLGDYETSKFYSDYLGHERESFVNVSSPSNPDPWDQITGEAQMTFSVSQSYQPILQTTAFSGMPNGGKGNKFLVGAILIRAGQPFRTGQRWQYLLFSQR